MGRGARATEKSVTEMTKEEFKAWLAEPDPEPAPPSAWPLTSNEGRCGFLEAYIWRGEEALFEAVSHIWKCLNHPKNERCIMIGALAGTGGSGKWALAKFLRRALRDALDDGLEAPWVRHSYPDLATLHQAAMGWFDASYAHYERAVQKYADILNGEPGRHAPVRCKVIQGPWAVTADEEITHHATRRLKRSVIAPRPMIGHPRG